MRPDADLAPDRHVDSLVLWLNHPECGPGSFLTAVLENNLKEAVARADEESLDALPHIVAWLYDRAPNVAWGSPKHVHDWQGLGPTYLATRNGVVHI